MCHGPTGGAQQNWAPKGGATKGRAPKGGATRVGAEPRKKWDPEEMGPKGGAPKGGGPKFRAFFSVSRHHFRSFCISLGVFLWFFVFRSAGAVKCSRLEFLGCAAPKPPKLRTTAREPKRAHFRVRPSKTPPKFNERTPKRDKKERNGGGRGKKERNFGLSGGGLSAGLQKHHQNSTKGPQRETKKNEMVAGKGEKSEILGCPAEGCPAERGSAEKGPAQGGPNQQQHNDTTHTPTTHQHTNTHNTHSKKQTTTHKQPT